MNEEKSRPADVFNLADIGKSHETVYELEDHDAKSLLEIKRMLNGRLYKSREKAHEHLVYLEHLENKLAHIFSEERKAGILNQPLETFLTDLPGLIRRLNAMMESLP